MEYPEMTVWTVVKRFLTGWAAAGLLLVAVSWAKYREFIVVAFANNTWAWINALFPAVLVVFIVCYLLKSLFW